MNQDDGTCITRGLYLPIGSFVYTRFTYPLWIHALTYVFVVYNVSIHRAVSLLVHTNNMIIPSVLDALINATEGRAALFSVSDKDNTPASIYSTRKARRVEVNHHCNCNTWVQDLTVQRPRRAGALKTSQRRDWSAAVAVLSCTKG